MSVSIQVPRIIRIQTLTIRMCCCRWQSSSSHQIIESVKLSADPCQEELAAAIQPFFAKQSPVLLRGAVRNAPAIQLWKSLDYWEHTAATDTEDGSMGYVEIGGSYANDGMERAEISLESYIQYLKLFESRYGRTGGCSSELNDAKNDNVSTSSSVVPPKEEIVYMAQNDLFPSLYKDIIIPDFCQGKVSHTNVVGLGRMYSVMLWLGPRGCVSPLHFDPLDNCFMQYVGHKRVWLYEPRKGDWHYAGLNGQQSNTSPINPEDDNMDWSRYPLFQKEAPTVIHCDLTPGDILYIPAKWWHYVRSIETSASVNVWWR